MTDHEIVCKNISEKTKEVLEELYSAQDKLNELETLYKGRVGELNTKVASDLLKCSINRVENPM